MRTIIKIISVVLIYLLITINSVFGQTFPKTFNYQAVARSEDGTPIANKNVVVEISILQGIGCETGNICNLIYKEIHEPTTNDFGLFNIEIGAGQTTYEGSIINFSQIIWDNVTDGNYFIKTRVDFGDEIFVNGLLDMGTTKLNSVPYSLVAVKSDSARIAENIKKNNGKLPFGLSELSDININGATANQFLQFNGTNWVNASGSQSGAQYIDDLIDVEATSPANNQTLVYNGTQWVSQKLSILQLDHTNISNPLLNQILSFDGTNWVNTNPIIELGSLNDVSIVSPSNGQVLTYNNGNWINQTTSGGSAWIDASPYLYYNGTNKVGIGTATPADKFQVNLSSGEGVVFNGSTSGTSIINLGAGSRFAFYPSKAAIRAGSVNGTQWDNLNIGSYSAAFGYNTTVNGSYSFSAGSGNNITGQYASALGENNTISGEYGFAAGQYNTVGGIGGVAFGSSNTANALFSIVIGSNNSASQYSLALGENNNASGNYSLAINYGNISQGIYSATFGNTNRCYTSSNAGFAAGINNENYGRASTVFGEGNISNAYCAFIVGRYNLSWGNSATTWSGSDPLFVVGNGTAATLANRSDAFYILQNGTAYMAGTIYNPSDSRLKKNIHQINGSLEKIVQLNPVSYYWRKDVNASASLSNEKQIGLIAQDIENLFPELVSVQNNGYKSINYIGFIPYLIEAVKEQQKIIDELKIENQKLFNQQQLSKAKESELENKYNELFLKLKTLEEKVQSIENK